jgi:hypothetical protein
MMTNRSDPTENDGIEGLRPNARGPGLVTFGVSLCYEYAVLSGTHHFVFVSFTWVEIMLILISVRFFSVWLCSQTGSWIFAKIMISSL